MYWLFTIWMPMISTWTNVVYKSKVNCLYRQNTTTTTTMKKLETKENEFKTRVCDIRWTWLKCEIRQQKRKRDSCAIMIAVMMMTADARAKSCQKCVYGICVARTRVMSPNIQTRSFGHRKWSKEYENHLVSRCVCVCVVSVQTIFATCCCFEWTKVLNHERFENHVLQTSVHTHTHNHCWVILKKISTFTLCIERWWLAMK